MSDQTLGQLCKYAFQSSPESDLDDCWEDAAQAVADEYMKRLRALCEEVEPELDNMIDRPDDYSADETRAIACKLYDAIMDPEEAKP